MYPYLYVFGKTIGAYGFMMALAFLVVGGLAVRVARKQGLLMEDVLIVGAFALGSALFAGRLLYIFVTYPVSVLWEMLYKGDHTILTGGGIVFYGGLIGGICGAFLGVRTAGCTFRAIEGAIVPYIPLGHAIGRIGCLLAGCCYGKEYEGFFAVHYPNSILGLLPEQGYFPIQLVETILNMGICAWLIYRRKRVLKTFDLLFSYLCLYATTRFILEFFRGDDVRGVYFWLSTSQWISLGLLAIYILRNVIIKSRYP